MTSLEIRPDLAARLQDLAERENRSVDQVLESLLPAQPAPDEEDNRIPLHMRPMFYRRARRYWKEIGDTERLALTDEQLDKQFWVFDTEGIPRLKSEQRTIVLPDDPLMAMAEASERYNFHSDRSDISENTNDILREMTSKRNEQEPFCGKSNTF